MNTAIKRPVLRYFGGKWKLAPWIIENLPAHRTYVEPFGGAASVLITKPRSHSEVYNDLDEDAVNVFRVYQDPESASRLLRSLKFTPFAREEFHTSLLHTDDPVERARRTIVRNFFGFASQKNGKARGFRSCTSSSGCDASKDWRNYTGAAEEFVERLTGVVIENKDAIEVMRQHDSPETLFFVDPPYVPETRINKDAYTFELTEEQHKDLIKVLDSLSGMVILCGYPNAIYDSLGWESRTKEHYANGCDADARKRTEKIWLNPAAARAGTQPSLFGDTDAAGAVVKTKGVE